MAGESVFSNRFYGKLDALLDERARLRRLYALFVDAYNISSNELWIDHAKLIEAAGKRANLEIEFLLNNETREHSSGQRSE